jgi:putative phosphoribosyl transferase
VRYANRDEAGRVLADALAGYAGDGSVLVLGLPRGGVPVAAQIARALPAALDVWMVRKLGAPGHPEFAVGALAEGGVRLVDAPVVRRLGISEAQLAEIIARETAELERRAAAYRSDHAAPDLTDRLVILVDDGLATGLTMRASVASVRQQSPRRVVVAVPVAPPDTCRVLEREADEVVCPWTPEPFIAVGRHYLDFEPPSDEEVRRLLLPPAG